MPSYLSRIKPNGEQGPEYKLKDEEIREVVQNMQTNKADKEEVEETDTPNSTPFLYRETPYEADRVFLDKLVGGSVAWNQLVANSGSSLSVTIPSGHKYVMKKSGTWSIGASTGSAITGLTGGSDIVTDITLMFGTTIADYVYSLEQATEGSGIAWLKSHGFFTEDYYPYNAGELISVKTSGKKYVGFNQNEEHTYDISNIDLRGIPKLVNNELVYDGDTYESNGDVTRKYGVVDLGTLNWNYNSGEYSRMEASFSLIKNNNNTGNVAVNIVCEKYIRASSNNVYYHTADKIIGHHKNLGKLWVYDSAYTDATAFKTAMSGVYLIYELATPTTETTDPFTNPQICYKDGTEEFIDNRTVPIPVGHNSRYADLPAIMEGDYLSYMARNFASEKYVDTELDTKVDKVTGKGLSANDYTNEEKALVETIPDKVDTDEIKGTQTATGNPITLTDGSETYAQGLVVELEPVQDLHGYDFPWVGGAGKNKLQLNDNVISQSGVTIKIENSKIYLNGTSTNSVDIIIGNFNGNGNYIANDLKKSTLVDVYCTASGGTVGFTATDVTIINDGTTANVKLYFTSGITFNNVVLEPMVRLSTETDPAFAPYSNICPISGYEGVEVDRCGKNLLDISKAASITTPQETQRNGVYINTYGNGERYTLSRSGGNAVYISFVDSNGVWQQLGISGQDKSVSFQSYGDEVCVNAGGGGLLSNTYDLQLEEGETATPYKPYQSRTASVTFGQTVYGGSVDFLTGVLTVDKGFDTFDGSSDETLSYISPYLQIGNVSPIHKNGATPISNMYKGVSVTAWAQLNNGEFSFHPSDGDIIRIYDNAKTSLSEWKTYLASNNLQICYEIATPFTIQLTPDELKLLKGVNNLSTNGTTITLDYIPNNSIGDAVKASEEYTNRRIAELYEMIEALQQNS